MMLGKFKVVAATIVAVAASVLLVAPADAGKKATQEAKAITPSPNSIKLENGVWVAKVVEAPMQWNYVSVADPSGRHGVGYGKVDVGIYIAGLDEMVDDTSPLLIDVVLTSPGTATFNSVWYGIKKESDGLTTGKIMYIGVNRGELKFDSRDQAKGTHNITYYWPESDTDGDGFPDPGAVPIAPTQTVHTIDTRLGQ